MCPMPEVPSGKLFKTANSLWKAAVHREKGWHRQTLESSDRQCQASAACLRLAVPEKGEKTHMLGLETDATLGAGREVPGCSQQRVPAAAWGSVKHSPSNPKQQLHRCRAGNTAGCSKAHILPVLLAHKNQTVHTR